MDALDIKSWSEEIVRAISHAHMAHSVHPVAPDDTVRFHDRSTPYFDPIFSTSNMVCCYIATRIKFAAGNTKNRIYRALVA